MRPFGRLWAAAYLLIAAVIRASVCSSTSTLAVASLRFMLCVSPHSGKVRICCFGKSSAVNSLDDGGDGGIPALGPDAGADSRPRAPSGPAAPRSFAPPSSFFSSRLMIFSASRPWAKVR